MKQAKFNQGMQRFLAVAVVLGVMAILGALIWRQVIPEGVKDILLILVTLMVAEFKTVYAYFFDGTAGQAKKDADGEPPADKGTVL